MRRALQGLDEANQRGERRTQLMARVGDEVDAQPLDPPRFGLIAQVMSVATTVPSIVASGATVTSNNRSTGTRSLHCTVSASPLAITRRRASMTSGARKPSTNGSPTRSPGNRLSAGWIGRHGALVRTHDHRRLGHGADQLRREWRSCEVGELLRVVAGSSA